MSESFERILRISCTIGPVDSGIISVLSEAFTRKTGIKVTYEKAGTGRTLKKAKTGAFDMVIVHARPLEDKFIAEGYGIDRRDVMYNDFVILGPTADPARINGLTDVKEAFRRIAESKSRMISRGDESGTHVKEVEIWNSCGIEPLGSWYERWLDGGKGNMPTALYADEEQAYILVDRATYLALRNETNLNLFVEGDPFMMNYIALIRVNPDVFPDINIRESIDFADFIVSKEAQELIRTFKADIYGEPLFFPNAE